MSKTSKSAELQQETSLIFKNPYIEMNENSFKNHFEKIVNEKQQHKSPKSPMNINEKIDGKSTINLGQRVKNKEENETLQDAYSQLKAKVSELTVRSVSTLTQCATNEYILYYKLGRIFIRPMGVFSGIIVEEFHSIVPYSFRRSNGELDWLKYTPNNSTLAHDYNFIYVTNNNSSKSVMILPNNDSKAFVFGEIYRGFVFGSPSTLDLKGRIFIGRTKDDGSIEEIPIKSSSIIEIIDGLIVIFICDFSNIIIIPDNDCHITIKALMKDVSKKKSDKKSPSSYERSKSSSRKKGNVRISIKQTDKTTTTTLSPSTIAKISKYDHLNMTKTSVDTLSSSEKSVKKIMNQYENVMKISNNQESVQRKSLPTLKIDEGKNKLSPKNRKKSKLTFRFFHNRKPKNDSKTTITKKDDNVKLNKNNSAGSQSTYKTIKSK